ncbi:sulfotransferase [Nonlabens xiamenensis]|uniref:sulfotransferase n=1 Tax=Nonlabens xiamenensis TaxID=2341043 RepID=UPI0013DDF646|nr:sulfotransferase [Nonlabens xiamenensis]
MTSKNSLPSNFQQIHHVSSEFLNQFYANYEPVFVLNTGRSGSAFIQRIFKNYSEIDAHHEAFPNLFLLSDYALFNQDKHETLQMIFESARIELMLQSSIQNKIYLESNQCLVFYIHQIKSLFPKAKFVHLTRHPGDFIRSAIMKGWHRNDTVWEMGRIKNPDRSVWESYSQIEKLAWVWNATHDFIEEFKKDHLPCFLTLKLEDLTKDLTVLKSLFQFIGINNHLTDKELIALSNKRVNKVTITGNEPRNMFKLSNYPEYQAWKENEKQEMINLVENLSGKYNYEL